MTVRDERGDVQLVLPGELANRLVESIEKMGIAAPLEWKQLWGHIMVHRCPSCRVYGIALCRDHGEVL